MMRLVIVESPFSGDRCVNIAYARAALLDCLLRGEAPLASHLLYTQPGVLDDLMPDDRQKGIAAGLEWARFADATVVYTDLGITEGMHQGVKHAELYQRAVEYRSMPDWVIALRDHPTYMHSCIGLCDWGVRDGSRCNKR